MSFIHYEYDIICERFETFAWTINKHLAFNGNWSEIKSGFNMSFGDRAEQRTYICFSVGLGKSTMDTKTTTWKDRVVAVFPEH